MQRKKKRKGSKFDHVMDLHTHTLASGHAFDKIEKIAETAEKKGLKLIAVTDHGTTMSGTSEPDYFQNLSVSPITSPMKIGNVIILRGIEANVITHDASLDVPSNLSVRFEWVIASLHEDIIVPVNSKVHTEIYLRLAENPLVDMIGHPDTPAYEFDHERVIREFGVKGKVVEINNHHAFHMGIKNTEICEKIAKLCMKYEVCIAVNSDAHSAQNVGRVSQAFTMLEKIGFPEELILNTSMERILTRVRKRHPRYAA